MKAKRSKQSDPDELLIELAKLSDSASREKFLRGHRQLLRRGLIEQLYNTIHEQLKVDVPRAAALAEACLAIAQKMGDKDALARSLRAKANTLYSMGQNRAAVGAHQQSLALFEELGETAEIARTLSASIQPLALLGEYDRAFAAAERARKIFTDQGGDRRLARLENNVGNILYRQDRFAEALPCYERAYQQLLPHQDTEGIAVTLHNMAVCLISMNDFHRALETYQRARELSQRDGLPRLTIQSDYNIAYLHYLRGQYSKAIEMLRATREVCARIGDAYHAALCNLDQSEMYLELNLSQEAAEMAQQASVEFQKLGLGYEAAKSVTNLAIALSQQGKAFRALELFAQARAAFVREKNRVWPSLLDLYQALVLYNEGRFFEARRLCSAALEFFRSSLLSTKEVLCHQLLARLCVRTGEKEAALRHCQDAFAILAKLEAPVLNYQAHFLTGQIQEAAGIPESAYVSYQAARRALEMLRSSLRGEELKIAFMKNKLEVYESLVRLCMDRDQGSVATEEAFGYMEEAKSRSLRDLIFERAQPLPPDEPGRSELVKYIRDLREELNWYYHRIEMEQLSREECSPERLEALQVQMRARESDFLRVLRELPSSEAEGAGLRSAPALSVEAIRTALGADATLVEYFSVGERLLAALLTQETLEIVPVTLLPRVSSLLRMLRFQLSKFRLGTDYVGNFPETLLKAAQSHLEALYQEVVAPLRYGFQKRHLVFVPHGALHYLPFPALFDGRQYLIDSHTISYAPSASIYALCCRKSVNTAGSSLILGVPGREAPHILGEVQSVAAVLPRPELFLGAAASEKVLKEKGPGSRFVHIATHGYFREDNPMFSGIRIGDSYLSLYDLYQLKLPVELATLSGCATGLNVVAAGDELLGLVRGLLSAGAQSLLLTLWDVHDRTTAEFMKCFYGHLQNNLGKARALQQAMQELRERHPHPYYWAPFMLLGKALA